MFLSLPPNYYGATGKLCHNNADWLMAPQKTEVYANACYRGHVAMLRMQRMLAFCYE